MENEEPHISLTLLGSFSLRVEGRYCPPLPRKAQALIAFLALQGRPVPREAAVATIWGDDVAGEHCLSPRHALTVIRQRVGVPLVRLARGMMTLRRDVAIDVPRFESLAGSADRGKQAWCAALYRGELLENVATVSPAFDEWLAVERIRLAAIAAEVVRRLALSHADAGEFDAAVATARRLVALDELREDGHRLLIAMLERCGRDEEAMRHSGLCQRLLVPRPAAVKAQAPAATPVGVSPVQAAAAASRGANWLLGGIVALACLSIISLGGAMPSAELPTAMIQYAW